MTGPGVGWRPPPGAARGAVRGLAATWRGAWAETVANRPGFSAQVGIMMVNNLAWIVFWVLLFRRVGTVRGWAVDDVIVLLSVITLSVGLALGALANCRWIGDLANGGGIDAALALPVPTLPYLLCRRVDAVNVGDAVFGLGLFALAGQPTPARAAAFALATVCATVILLGFLVLVGSLAFFARATAATELGFQSILLFSMYPIDLFSGSLRIVLYGAVPAALIGSVPATLVTDFQAGQAAVLVGAAIVFGTLGWTVFYLGLARYTSGASWSDA